MLCGWLLGGTLHIHDHLQLEPCLEQMGGHAVLHSSLSPINYLRGFLVGQRPRERIYGQALASGHPGFLYLNSRSHRRKDHLCRVDQTEHLLGLQQASHVSEDWIAFLIPLSEREGIELETIKNIHRWTLPNNPRAKDGDENRNDFQ